MYIFVTRKLFNQYSQSRPNTSMKCIPLLFDRSTIKLLFGVQHIEITLSLSGYIAQHFEYFLNGWYSNTVLLCPPNTLPVRSKQRH